MQTMTVGSIFNRAWKILKENIFVLLGLCVSYFAISFLFQILFGETLSPPVVDLSQKDQLVFMLERLVSISFWLFLLLSASLNASFTCIYSQVVLDAIDGKELKFYFNIRKILNIVISTFLYSLVVAAGFLFFIIPGIYLAIRLQFVPLAILDKDLSFGEAFEESWRITRGHFGLLFLLILSYIGIAIIGFLLLFVGILPAAVIIYNMSCITYRDLVHSLEEENGVKENEPHLTDMATDKE